MIGPEDRIIYTDYYKGMYMVIFMSRLLLESNAIGHIYANYVFCLQNYTA